VRYETAFARDKYLVVVNGGVDEVARASDILKDIHAARTTSTTDCSRQPLA